MEDAQKILVLRKKRLKKTELEEHLREVSRSFGIDGYTARTALVGDGLAVLKNGEPSDLQKSAGILTRLGYDWCLTDTRPPRMNAFDVKRFSLSSSDIVFENNTGARRIRKGDRILVVLAGLTEDMMSRLLNKANVRNGANVGLTAKEKRNIILASSPVLDLYPLSDPTDEKNWTAVEPIRIRPGKFDPSSLGERSAAGGRQNLQEILDLTEKLSSLFFLEMDFGLFRLPSCEYTVLSEEQGEKLNLDNLIHYGWYLQHLLKAKMRRSLEKSGAIIPADLGAKSAKDEEANQAAELVKEYESVLPPPPQVERSVLLDWLMSREGISIIAFVLYTVGGPLITNLLRASMKIPAIPDAAVKIFVVSLIVFFAYGTFHFLKLRRWIENTPTSPARSAAMGLVEMKGHCRRAYNLLSPITQTPCVYYTLKRYEKGKNPKHPEEYVLVSSTNSGPVPFYLQDETGRVLVDPAGASISPSVSQTHVGDVRLPWGSRVPIGAHVKYDEGLIPEGSRLYVLGFAVPKPVATIPMRQRIAEKLRLLKSERSKLDSYDTNHDGVIDQQEWEVARRDAEQEILKETLEEKAGTKNSAEQVLIKKPPYSGLPYVISDSFERKLTLKFGILAALMFLCTLGATAVGVFMFFG